MDNTLFFLIAAFVLLILIPFFIIRDMKREEKPIKIFTSNIMLIVLFLVAIGEVLRSILTAEAMGYFNQAFFLFLIIFIVAPLVFLLLYQIKKDIKKWSDPKEYKYYWAYKIRYILIIVIAIVFVGALYRFYLVYKVVF